MYWFFRCCNQQNDQKKTNVMHNRNILKIKIMITTKKRKKIKVIKRHHLGKIRLLVITLFSTPLSPLSSTPMVSPSHTNIHWHICNACVSPDGFVYYLLVTYSVAEREVEGWCSTSWLGFITHWPRRISSMMDVRHCGICSQSLSFGLNLHSPQSCRALCQSSCKNNTQIEIR